MTQPANGHTQEYSIELISQLKPSLIVATMFCMQCPKAELTLYLDQLQETTNQKRMAVPVTLQYINLEIYLNLMIIIGKGCA